MDRFCPLCGIKTSRIDEKEWDEEWDQGKTPVHLFSLVISCGNCGYGTNCVSTKKVK